VLQNSFVLVHKNNVFLLDFSFMLAHKNNVFLLDMNNRKKI